MLEKDPKKRIKIEEVLESPWLKEISIKSTTD